MSGNISLAQPLIEQESVREILNLPTEDVNPKVSLEDILKIAQSAVQSELVNRGRAPAELLGLRVYCASHESSDYREAPSIEWGQLIEEPENISASDAKDTPSIQLPIESKFLGDLGGRLAEMSTKNSPDLGNVSMLLSFSPSTMLGVGNCDKDGYIKGSKPKVRCVPQSAGPSKSES
jgi:hypothetical protein